MVGGPEGGTAGMRFNPRESAEELQGDSQVGREDSDERARHDAKKREEQEQRAHKLQGLQHMKIKIPQKSPEDEEDSQVKQQAELSQLTGQVGQSEANAGANPRASGMGMNMMLSSAPFIDEAFDMIRKKRDGPKYDDEKPKATTTIETQMQRRRAKKGRRKKGKMETTETKARGKGKKSKQYRVGPTRRTGAITSMMAGSAPYRSFGGFYGHQRANRFGFPRLSSASRSQARLSANPRTKIGQDIRQEIRQESPPLDDPIPTPTMTPEARIVRTSPVRGSHDARPHGKATRQPRTARTPLGQKMSHATSLAGGAGGIGATDAILASEEFLKARAQRVKLVNRISPRDRIEYRQLIDQLNHLMRRMMRKEDKSMQGATEGATDNASGGLTSAPTGATETDPDDDATRWGAHPYDLYVRRGGLG